MPNDHKIIIVGILLVLIGSVMASGVCSIDDRHVTYTQNQYNFSLNGGTLNITLDNAPPNITSLMYYKSPTQLKFAYNFSLPSSGYDFKISINTNGVLTHYSSNKTIVDSITGYIINYTDVVVNNYNASFTWNAPKGELTLKKSWATYGIGVGNKVEVDPYVGYEPNNMGGWLQSNMRTVVRNSSGGNGLITSEAASAKYFNSSDGTTWQNNSLTSNGYQNLLILSNNTQVMLFYDSAGPRLSECHGQGSQATWTCGANTINTGVALTALSCDVDKNDEVWCVFQNSTIRIINFSIGQGWGYTPDDSAHDSVHITESTDVDAKPTLCVGQDYVYGFYENTSDSHKLGFFNFSLSNIGDEITASFINSRQNFATPTNQALTSSCLVDMRGDNGVHLVRSDLSMAGANIKCWYLNNSGNFASGEGITINDAADCTNAQLSINKTKIFVSYAEQCDAGYFCGTQRATVDYGTTWNNSRNISGAIGINVSVANSGFAVAHQRFPAFMNNSNYTFYEWIDWAASGRQNTYWGNDSYSERVASDDITNAVPTVGSTTSLNTSLNGSAMNTTFWATCTDTDGGNTITSCGFYIQNEGATNYSIGTVGTAIGNDVNCTYQTVAVAVGDLNGSAWCYDGSANSTLGTIGNNAVRLDESTAASAQQTTLLYTANTTDSTVWFRRVVTLDNTAGDQAWALTLTNQIPANSGWAICEGTVVALCAIPEATGTGTTVSWEMDTPALTSSTETILYNYSAAVNFTASGARQENVSATTEASQNYSVGVNINETVNETFTFAYDVSALIAGYTTNNTWGNTINGNAWTGGGIAYWFGDWIDGIDYGGLNWTQNVSLTSNVAKQYFNMTGWFNTSANLPTMTIFNYTLGATPNINGTCNNKAWYGSMVNYANLTIPTGAGSRVGAKLGGSADCISEYNTTINASVNNSRSYIYGITGLNKTACIYYNTTINSTTNITFAGVEWNFSIAGLDHAINSWNNSALDFTAGENKTVQSEGNISIAVVVDEYAGANAEFPEGTSGNTRINISQSQFAYSVKIATAIEKRGSPEALRKCTTYCEPTGGVWSGTLAFGDETALVGYDTREISDGDTLTSIAFMLSWASPHIDGGGVCPPATATPCIVSMGADYINGPSWVDSSGCLHGNSTCIYIGTNATSVTATTGGQTLASLFGIEIEFTPAPMEVSGLFEEEIRAFMRGVENFFAGFINPPLKFECKPIGIDLLGFKLANSGIIAKLNCMIFALLSMEVNKLVSMGLVLLVILLVVGWFFDYTKWLLIPLIAVGVYDFIMVMTTVFV